MSKPLTPIDILDVVMPGDVQVSPDGSQCAFVLVRMDRRDNALKAGVWIVPTDASAPARKLTAGERRDFSPRWSPDGRWLGFLSNRETEWRPDLYVIDMRGSEPRKVAQLPRGIEDYAWSPDSTHLALLGRPDYPLEPDRDSPRDDNEVRQRYLERVHFVNRFKYRFDGAGLLDDEPRRIWVCGREGGDPKPLTDGPWEVLRPRWMPDGRIAFLSNRDTDHERSDAVDLWAVSSDGGDPVKLSPHRGTLLSFSFGPDGKCALIGDFEDDFYAYGGARHSKVFVDFERRTRSLNRTAGITILADTLAPYDIPDPVWSPDGRWLHFVVSNAGTLGVYRMTPDGEAAPFIHGRRVIPSFSIGSSTVAFVASAPDDSGSIRAVNLDGSNERVLHDPNPWIRERALGTLRELAVEVDGTRIDAWALLPPGYAGGTRVPTLLEIHGGPHGAYGWNFSLIFQILAGAGYAVVYCNPPGSQSYDEAFARAVVGHWGEVDFPFFMRLADVAVEQGFADAERLGVCGASYGAYSTLWSVTHSDRFKAAVAARPMSLLEGFYGTSDIAWNFLVSEMEAEPWQNLEQYRRLSPALMLEHVNTPLRLIACLADFRTPPEQAEQVYWRLKKMGKETDLVLFHGESHQIVTLGRPWSRVRHMQALQEWFDRWLKSPGTQPTGALRASGMSRDHRRP